MLLNYEDLSPVHKAVEVEIPVALIEQELRRVTGEFSRHAKVSGFRPGKVPASIVRSRFAKDIHEEVMKRLLPLTFREAVEEKGLEPVGDPHLEHCDPFIDGAPIRYKAEFDVKPQFELRAYRGLEVEEPKIEVTEADIDAMIDRIRDQASSYRSETDRGLADGDIALIDIASSVDGVALKTDSGHFRMGEETPMPELQEALFDKKAGESASFEKAYGDDATTEAFRGKTVRHDVTIKEIRVQEKPDVTDELAKSVGGWESVAEMRDTIGNDIRKHREVEAQRLKRNQLGDRLLATHVLDVPDSLVEQQLGKSLSDYARYLVSQGVDVEKADLDWPKLSEEFRPEAVRRVKRSLILEAIAKKEELAVSDVEVDAEIRRAAKEQDRDFAEIRHRLRGDGGYEALRVSMAQEKALEIVVREAVAK